MSHGQDQPPRHGYAASADPDRSRRQCHQGHRRRAQCAAGRHFRALYEDQEFPLAHERPAFPRLSSAARRAGRPDFRHDRRARRARAQDRRRHVRSIGDIARQQRIADNDAAYVTPDDMLAELRDDNQRFIASMRETHDLCDEHDDVATASLLEVYIDEAEKRVWFLYEAGRRGDPTGTSAQAWHDSASANASAPKLAKRASAGRGKRRQRQATLP